LGRIYVYMGTAGSPTGTVGAYIYTHSGTYGTSSVPTTPLLASSNLVNAADITAGLNTFEFEDEFTLVNTTNYCLAIVYTSGTATNYLTVSYDNTSPTHGGNAASFGTSTWTAQSGWDLYFLVYGGAILKITATNASNPTLDHNPGAGATIIDNEKSVTFTGMKDNTEVRVYETGTTTEIDGIENATAGSPDDRSFTWSANATTVVDYVIHNVSYEYIRVEGYTVGTVDTTIPIQQRFDRNYSNP
jgi:hypothetical protein